MDHPHPTMLKTFPSLHLCNTVIRELKRASVGLPTFHDWDSPTLPTLKQFDPDAPFDLVRLQENLSTLRALHSTLMSEFMGVNSKNTPQNLLWAHDLVTRDTNRVKDEEIADYLAEARAELDNPTSIQLAQHMFAKKTQDARHVYSMLKLIDPGLEHIDKVVAMRFLALHTNDKEPYTLKEFEHDVLTWRNRDLMLPFLIGAHYMHQASMWHVKPDSPRFAVIQGMLDSLNDPKITWDDAVKVCQNLPPDMFLAYTIEQLGYIFGCRPLPSIKGNFLDFLCSFVSTMGNTFPKAWLCPYLAGYDKPTIGFETLQWKCNGRSLTLDDSKLGMVAHTVNKKRIPYVPCANILLRVSSLIYTDDVYRLLKRTEDVTRFLRDGVASTMLSPRINAEDKLAFLTTAVGYASPALTDCVRYIESNMDEHRRTKTLELAEPFTIVAWSLEPPKRVVTFTKAPDLTTHCLSQPHRLSRAICKELSVVRPISRITVCKQEPAGTRQAVRDSIRQHFAATLTNFQENTNYLHTILHESVACFALHEPEHHSVVPLHATTEWDQAYHDTRYAQTETDARGGGRYIDRCNFVPTRSKYDGKSRLNAHVVPVSKLYVCNCPYVSADAPTAWVRMSSSVPIKSFALKNIRTTDTSDPAVSSRVGAFFHSVHAHFKGHVHKIPLHPDAEAYPLDRADVQFYDDPVSQSVMMVYASPADPRKTLDFAILQLV